jgi:hypothetical protein
VTFVFNDKVTFIIKLNDSSDLSYLNERLSHSKLPGFGSDTDPPDF